MKNFDWTSYKKRIAVKAPIDKVYAAWTTAEELERWFLENVTFYDNTNALVDRKALIGKGFIYAWKWYIYDEIMKGKIVEENGVDFIQFTFEGETIVEIKLSTEHDYTVVELTHKNIPIDDKSKQFIRLGCASGWTFYLINLKSVYEGGLDLRNKDGNLSPMINN